MGNALFSLFTKNKNIIQANVFPKPCDHLFSFHVHTPVQSAAVMRQKVAWHDNQEDDDNNVTR